MFTDHCICSKNVTDAFVQLATNIYTSPDYEVNPRGMKTKEWLGVMIKITNPYDRVVTNKYRAMSLKYGIGEWLWYLRASEKLDEIAYYSKFWNKLSDDGKTANSAYGVKMFKESTVAKLSQWEFAKRELLNDSSSRRAVIQILSPQNLYSETKDLPCTLSLQFLIRENQLHLFCNMRSNDLVLGFPYDVFSFTLFQEVMLLELQKGIPNLSMGNYYHSVSSLHIYEKDFQMIETILNNPYAENTCLLPRLTILEDLQKLQYNEEIIRTKSARPLGVLRDNLCIEFQKYLTGELI